MTTPETYRIAKKGTYRVRRIDGSRVVEHSMRGADLLTSLERH